MLRATMTRLARRFGLLNVRRRGTKDRRPLLESLVDRRLLAADFFSGEGESQELIIDNRDAAAVTTDGAWHAGSGVAGFVAEDYLFNIPDPILNVVTLVDTVTFTPDLADSGKYEISARWTSHPNRASNALITVDHRDGVTETRVDQRVNGGTWVELGEFNLNGGTGQGVTISSEGADGVTVADAVRLVRVADADPAPAAKGSVVVDNNDPSGVQVRGSWLGSSGVPGFFDSDYLFTQTPGVGAVTYTPDLGADAEYEVFARWTSHPNRATNTPITINHADGTTVTRVNQQENGGAWVSLGEFNLQTRVSSVAVGADGIDGVAVADAIRFVRVGETVQAPEITVLRGATEVRDGGVVDFGVTTVGSSVNVELTIRNDGTAPLTLVTQNPDAPFTLVDTPLTPLQPGRSSTLSVRMNAGSVGAFSVPLQIASNDADESPYDLLLRGIVNSVPPVAQEVVVDNDDPNGVAVVGNWFSSDGVPGFFDNDYLFTQTPNSGSVTFTPDLEGGEYEVFVRWTSHPNRATNAPIAVRHSAGTFQTRVNQQTDGGQWVSLGEFGFSPGNAAVVVGTEGIDGVVVADAVRFVRTGATVDAPEIRIVQDGRDIPDGGRLDFGTTTLQGPVTIELTVRNEGTETLTLAPQSLAAPFELVTSPPSQLPAGQAANFSLRMNANSAGSFSAPFRIASNDADENPYDIALTGVVNLQPREEVIIDNDDPIGVQVSGAWFPSSGVPGFFDADYLFTQQVGPARVTFMPDLGGGGRFEVFGRWTSHPNRASNAQITVVHQEGNSQLLVNQQETGGEWVPLGEFDFDSGAASVVVSASGANGVVVADAFRFVRVDDPVTEPEITVLSDNAEVADGSSLQFGNTTVGEPVTLEVVVRNDGSDELTLEQIDAGSLPAGFTLASDLETTSLSPGESTSFSVRLDASSVGSFSGGLSLTNNDADENPYDINLLGTVEEVPTEPEITILDEFGGILNDGGVFDFGTTTVGTPVDMTITIQNDGDADLSLVPLDPNGVPAGFSGAAPDITSVSPGQSVVWSLRLLASDVGRFSGNLAILNGDDNENPYDLLLRGVVEPVVVSEPEITVLRSSVPLVDGALINFGSTTVGAPVDVNLAIRNDGDADLELGAVDESNVPAGFDIVQNVGGTLEPGQTAPLVLRLSALAGGDFSGAITIPNNDSDENPFDLNLSGQVDPGSPEITLIDQNGNQVLDGGTLDFGSTTVGTSVDRSVTIRNDGDAPLSLVPFDSSSLAGTGFSGVSPNVTTVLPGQSAVWAFRLLAASNGTFSAPVAIVNGDADENPFDITLEGVVSRVSTEPEITVLNGAAPILDGGTVSFGSTSVGNPRDVVLTIRNDGLAELTIDPPATIPAGFELVAAPAASVAPGGTTTTTLRLTAATRGDFTGTVVFANNDSNEGSFEVNLQGTATSPEITVLLDGTDILDGGTVDFGTTMVGSPVDVDLVIRNDGNASLTLLTQSPSLPFEIVTAPLTPLPAGQSSTLTLRLLATDPGSFSLPISVANNDLDETPFDLTLTGVVELPQPEIVLLRSSEVISDGGSIDFGTVAVGNPVDVVLTVRNVGNASLDFSAPTLPAGFILQSPPVVETLQPNQSASLTVRLLATNKGDFGGTLQIANNDADENPYDVLIEGTVLGPEIKVLRDAEEVADGGTVEFPETFVGNPTDVTLQVLNDGDTTLTLSPIDVGSLPDGFALVSGPESFSLAPGEQTPIVLQLTAAAEGTFGGTIQLGNDDEDESPYDLNLSGTVTMPRPEITVLRDSVEVLDGDVVDFGITPIGSSVDVLFVIKNDGGDDLELTQVEATDMPAGFGLLSPLGSTNLAPGEQTTLSVRLVATDPGAFTGALSIANTDNDENPFDITLAGIVADARYLGTAVGTATIPGFGDVPVDAPVDFFVAGTEITVLLPNGGTGTVGAGGTINFGTTEGGLGQCTFDGTIDGSQEMASGTWSCPALPAGGSATGTWQANRLGAGQGEGEGSDLAALLADRQPWWPAAVDQAFAEDDE